MLVVHLLAARGGTRESALPGYRVGPAAYVQCQGKGPKLRSTPLRKGTTTVLRTWLAERKGNPSDPAFPTIAGYATEPRRIRVSPEQAPFRRLSPTCFGKQAVHVLRHTWLWSRFTTVERASPPFGWSMNRSKQPPGRVALIKCGGIQNARHSPLCMEAGRMIQALNHAGDGRKLIWLSLISRAIASCR
jgi:hypothetical protein